MRLSRGFGTNALAAIERLIACRPRLQREHLYVQRYRNTTSDGWREVAKTVKNETSFRDTINLSGAVDIIVLCDRAEHDNALQAFRSRGYSEWPDGRALEDVPTYSGARQ